MARSLQTILDQLDEAQAAETELNDLNSTSQVAIYGLWKYITALCQYLMEQLHDLKVKEIETIISSAPVGSEPWLQSKVLEFQYDSVTPQLLTLVDFAAKYDPIDVSKRIITRAAVTSLVNNKVLVKVAKNDPPVALSGTELAALQSYLTDGGDGTYAGRGRGLGFAGVEIEASSYASDKLYLKGTIYYNGQYAATISADVDLAINNYLANLPFDGSVSLLGITDAIQGVPGVLDIKLTDVAIRADATAFSSKTYLVQNSTTYITTYDTYAGYVEEETTAGETFTDKLTFTAA